GQRRAYVPIGLLHERAKNLPLVPWFRESHLGERTYALSAFVLCLFLGRSWALTHLPKDAPTDFFRSNFAGDVNRFQTHLFRVMRLAEMLVNLQRVSGLDSVISQILHRVEAGYSEIE